MSDRPVKAVIFDMDGVLINSFESVYKVRTKLLAKHGVDINKVPDPHGERHRGSPAHSLLQAVSQSRGIIIDEQQFSRDSIDGIYRQLKDDGITADPELVRFLDDLQGEGVPCAVVTASAREGAYNKLRLLGIEKYFEAVVATDDVQESKPNPAPYLLAMERLGVKPGECVIFEDSNAGAAAGHRSGGLVIGFTKYMSPKKSLENVNAYADNWDEVNYGKLVDLVRNLSLQR